MSSLPFGLSGRRWFALFIAYGGLYGALLLALRPATSAGPAAVAQAAGAVPFLAAAVFAWRVRGQAPEARFARAWELLAFGSASWALAEVARASYLLLHGSAPPIPSVLDLLAAVSVPLLIAGLLRYPLETYRLRSQPRLLLDVALVVGTVVTLVYEVAMPDLALTSASLAPLTLFWGGLRQLLDVALLTAASALLLHSRPRGLRISALPVAGGLLTFAIADMIAGIQLLTGHVVVDVHVLAVGVLSGAGGLLFAALYGAARSGADVLRLGSPLAKFIYSLQRYLPLAATTLLFITVLFSVFDRPNAVTLSLAILLSSLLIVRQGMVLGESQLRRYEQLVNSTSDAAFICDHNGRIELANPAAAALVGLARGDTLARVSLSDLLSSQESPDLPPDMFATARERGWQGEVRLRRVKQGAHTIALTLDARRDEAGTPIGLVGSARDMTERLRMEAELRSLNQQMAAAQKNLQQINEELEQKVADRTANLARAKSELEQQYAELQTLDQLKSDFISMISHELRAPLTNINGGLELLLSRDEGMSLDTREALTLMHQETRRLTRIVESILDISAFEAGQLPLNPQPLHLAPLLEQVLSHVAAGGSMNRLQVVLPDALPALLADTMLLRSILFQLLDNALKYAPEGPITVHATTADRHVRVAVIDHGPGIPAEERERVFEKFHRAHASDAQNVYGYGLGLYTVRHYVTAMHGAVGCEATSGGGATFWFRLPVAAQATDFEFEAREARP